MVSGGRGLRFAGSFALDVAVGIRTGCPQPGKFTLGCFRQLHYSGVSILINVEPRAFELLFSAMRKRRDAGVVVR